MTSPSLAALPVPLATLLRRLITALSTLSITSLSTAAQPIPVPALEALQSQLPGEGDEKRKGKDERSTVWDELGWDNVSRALALRWPWRSTLLEQIPSSPSSSSSSSSSTSSLLSAFRSRSPASSSSPSPKPQQPKSKKDQPIKVPNTELYRLYLHPTLFDPLRTPRLPIVLCHGLYGFDVKGPSGFPALQMHYWAGVLKILRGKVGAEVVCPGVPGTGSIAQRASKMHSHLSSTLPDRDVNFIAHSMGGLDCRHLITHLKPEEYRPRSLMTIATPHRGSPVMDWCAANIGVGAAAAAAAAAATTGLSPSSAPPPPKPLPYSLKSPLLTRSPQTQKLTLTLSSLSLLPQSLTSLLLSMLDSPAYANLTTSYMQHCFNPQTPDVKGVRYWSVAGRVGGLSVLHPLWLPKIVMDAAEELELPNGTPSPDSSTSAAASSTYSAPSPTSPFNPSNPHTPGTTTPTPSAPAPPKPEADDDERGNDGLVSVKSAKWGEFLGVIEDCDHWEMRGARGLVRSWEVWGKAGEGASSSSSPSSSSSAATAGKETQTAAHLAEAASEIHKRKDELLERAHEATAEVRRLEREGRVDREERGAVERLGGVVEWITESVSSGAGVLNFASSSSQAAERGERHAGRVGRSEGEESERMRLDPAGPRAQGLNADLGLQVEGKRDGKREERFPPFELERFYVALCRKLYDEGL